MDTLNGKRILVTGAAAGIGKALAEQFGARGADLLLVDRDPAGLEAAAASLAARGVKVATYELDVTDTAGILALRDRIHRDGGPIDVLVNNAGLVFGGGFLDLPLEKHLTTYQVNTLGLVAMTHTFLPDLLGRPDAHLVNVASASGYIGLPFGATYASSKWAVIGLSESLQLELELQGHRNVHVTTVCPSYVSTGLFDGAKAPLTTDLLTADGLATQVVEAVLANAVALNTPWLVHATPILKGLLPFGLFYRVAAWLGVNTSMMEWRGRGAHEAAPPARRSA
jgi:all-trans-retinol dehydrogenase (NAD+)